LPYLLGFFESALHIFSNVIWKPIKD